MHVGWDAWSAEKRARQQRIRLVEPVSSALSGESTCTTRLRLEGVFAKRGPSGLKQKITEGSAVGLRTTCKDSGLHRNLSTGAPMSRKPSPTPGAQSDAAHGWAGGPLVRDLGKTSSRGRLC